MNEESDNARDESGLTKKQLAIMHERALNPRRGWLGKGDQRFPTREMPSEILKRVTEAGESNLIDRMVLTTHRLLANDNHDIQLRAVNIGRLMETVNQRDEIADDPFFNPSPETPAGGEVTYQQVNIYLPHNDRDPIEPDESRTHETNGRH